jgi:hypothetical protein
LHRLHHSPKVAKPIPTRRRPMGMEHYVTPYKVDVGWNRTNMSIDFSRLLDGCLLADLHIHNWSAVILRHRKKAFCVIRLSWLDDPYELGSVPK